MYLCSVWYCRYRLCSSPNLPKSSITSARLVASSRHYSSSFTRSPPGGTSYSRILITVSSMLSWRKRRHDCSRSWWGWNWLHSGKILFTRWWHEERWCLGSCGYIVYVYKCELEDVSFKTLGPEQNGWRFSDYICMFIVYKFHWRFFLRIRMIGNKSTFIQVMAWQQAVGAESMVKQFIPAYMHRAYAKGNFF